MSVDDEEKKLLPHHEQLPLCTTRLPYRQGRKLTAVKVYTINNESNHLLVFGVPSLNLRQEAKSVFIKFGRVLLFALSTTHPAEDFTETYHVQYDRIQSARIAKKIIDTKNFYGGSLHVCYAPEFESIDETRTKLLQRKNDVTYRLRNLRKESTEAQKSKEKELINSNKIVNATNNLDNELIIDEFKHKKDKLNSNEDVKKLNMGEINTVYLNKQKRKNSKPAVIEKKFKPCFQDKLTGNTNISTNCNADAKNDIEVVDCTSVEKEVVSNINEALNFDKFGNEVIKKIEVKPLNSIVFINNKRLL